MQLWNGWKPAVAPAAWLDVLRVGLGACLALGLSAWLLQLPLPGTGVGHWALFAPLGATSVLVFAVHTGPLSQPWSQDAGTRRQQRIWRLWGKKPPAAATVTAAALMQDAPLSVEDSTPVSQLLEALAEHTVPFVAVLRQGQLAGLITRSDIMRILLH